jgi:hypothetical protein
MIFFSSVTIIHIYKYDCFTPTATDDDIDALESLSKLDEDDE